MHARCLIQNLILFIQMLFHILSQERLELVNQIFFLFDNISAPLEGFVIFKCMNSLTQLLQLPKQIMIFLNLSFELEIFFRHLLLDNLDFLVLRIYFGLHSLLKVISLILILEFFSVFAFDFGEHLFSLGDLAFGVFEFILKITNGVFPLMFELLELF